MLVAGRHGLLRDALYALHTILSGRDLDLLSADIMRGHYQFVSSGHIAAQTQ